MTILDDNLALYDLATGTERIIHCGPYSVRQGFAISSDGLRFCFGQSNGGVALATLDEKTMLATARPVVSSGVCSHASFSPDGKRVVLSWRPTRKPGQLYLLSFDGDPKLELLKGQNAARNNFNPDWSPDGKTIVFASQLVPVENE